MSFTPLDERFRRKPVYGVGSNGHPPDGQFRLRPVDRSGYDNSPFDDEFRQNDRIDSDDIIDHYRDDPTPVNDRALHDESQATPNKTETDNRTAQLLNKPSAYEAYKTADRSESPEPSSWNPRNWSKKVYIIAAVILVICAAVGVTVGIIVSREERYPNYSKLDYSLVKVYGGTSFFDDFDYYTETDPSNGYVTYVDSTDAASLNLTYASSNRAIVRVDTSSSTTSSTSSASSGASSSTSSGSSSGQAGSSSGSSSSGPGSSSGSPPSRRQTTSSSYRNSVRITSKTQYNSGLFIFDIYHTPYGCATWPALWMSDPNNWPTHGEIDVVEAVNKGATGNQMTLHTTDDCTMKVKRKETGTALKTNCWNETNDNDGCGVKGKKATFGEEFNNNDGGVYALEYRDAGIRIWFWDRDNIPDDIDTTVSNTSSTTPNPSSWGEALADFPSTDCDIGNHFKNQSIIVNIDLCGDWAGSTYYYTDVADCPNTCEEYVAANGTAFSDAYWEFRSFKVYQTS